MRFVSLFSGAGGLDLGLEYAGWHCEYASDIDSAAVATLQSNRGRRTGGVAALNHTVVEQADVRLQSGQEILSRISRRRGDVPLLAGGPPCQSWSSAGHQLGMADPRGRLFEDYIRLATQLDVRWLMFENVRGLVTARGPDGVPGSALQLIRSALAKAGWETRVDLLNAADFGVPQRRVRLLLLGFRSGDAPPLPVPTHREVGDSFSLPWITLGECISRIRPPSGDEVIRPSGRLAVELAGLRPGTGVKSAGKRETTRPGGHWGYKQGAFVADTEKASRTITANPQQDWIVDRDLGLRRLSPRECAALQTFPPCWRFAGSRIDQYRLIGNAVPPKLAMCVGRSLLEHSKGAAKVAKLAEPVPLPARLQAAIAYTLREEVRNGASRRAVAPKRRTKIAARG